MKDFVTEILVTMENDRKETNKDKQLTMQQLVDLRQKLQSLTKTTLAEPDFIGCMFTVLNN